MYITTPLPCYDCVSSQMTAVQVWRETSRSGKQHGENDVSRADSVAAVQALHREPCDIAAHPQDIHSDPESNRTPILTKLH